MPCGVRRNCISPGSTQKAFRKLTATFVIYDKKIFSSVCGKTTFEALTHGGVQSLWLCCSLGTSADAGQIVVVIISHCQYHGKMAYGVMTLPSTTLLAIIRSCLWLLQDRSHVEKMQLKANGTSPSARHPHGL